METNTGSQMPQSSGKKGMGSIVIVLIVVVAVAAYFLFRNTSQDSAVESTQNAQQEESMVKEPAGNSVEGSQNGSTQPEVKIFTVEGKNFSFTPSEIKVNKGDKVKIVFKNTGGFHDFVLDEFSVKTAQLQDGATAEVEFTADKVGSFEYYCSVGSHRAMGMKGTLVVQ